MNTRKDTSTRLRRDLQTLKLKSGALLSENKKQQQSNNETS